MASTAFLTERHGWDDEGIRAVKLRLVQVCDAGIELWHDRRHLLGGRNIARVVGDPFPQDQKAVEADSKVTFSEISPPWT